MVDFGKYLTSLLRRRKMKTVCFVLLFVSAVFGDTGEEKSVPVMEGKNVTLPSDVKQPNETVRWYCNDTLVALINGKPSTSCLYDGEDGRFRGRLEVDYKTGSLIITDITTEHAGRYEAEIIRGNSTGKSVPLKRNGKCDSTKIYIKSSNSSDTIKAFNVHVSESDNVEKKQERERDSGLSSGLIAGTCAGFGVLLLVVAVLGVIYYRHRSSKMEDIEKNKFEQLLKVPV